MQVFGLQIKAAAFAKIFLTLVLLESLTACAKSGAFQSVAGSSSSTNVVQSPGDLPLTETPPAVVSPAEPQQPVTTPPAAIYQPLPLTWESVSHPERLSWSSGLRQIVSAYLPILDKAKDISLFCPNYSALSSDQKNNLWADLFAATSYYESAYDPKSNSVDVGSQNDPNSWSVGLLQLSVVDQESYNLPFGFSFSDLQDPIKNLQLGVAIMSAQVKKYGTVLINVGSPGLYWATLHPGGKYDESSAIEAKTKSLSFCSGKI